MICVHCLIVVMVFLPMLESSALAFQFHTLIMLSEISVWWTSDVRNMKKSATLFSFLVDTHEFVTSCYLL